MTDETYELGQAATWLFRAGGNVKVAADLSYGLTGRLYFSRSGWLLLSVPNALGQGAFDAINEPGIELPVSQTTGRYNAHITVMSPDDIAQIGGPNKITERGHEMCYTLGPLRVVEPSGWKTVSKCWFIEVKSPDLEKLRKSYGLTSLPGDDHPFHITVALRKKSVLLDNDVAMGRVVAASLIHNPARWARDFSRAVRS